MHGIYKYVLDDKIIYIGKTDKSFRSRINGHAKEDKFKKYLQKAEIYIFLTANSTETTVYEKLLINKYQPILNVVDTHDTTMGIDFKEPEWVSYEEFEYGLQEKKRIKRHISKINKDREGKIKSYQDLSNKYLYDLKLWHRELWLVNIFYDILDSHSFEKEISIPDKYYEDTLPDNDQFLRCTSLLFGFAWILNRDIRKYDICSLKEQYVEFFFAEHTGFHKYKFHILDHEILRELYYRMLDGYKQYVQIEYIKPITEKLVFIEKRLNEYEDITKEEEEIIR